MKEISKKTLKENSWHIKVMGAYVQQPVPGIYGLEDDTIISSVDAEALYPISTIYSNISAETLYGRLYDSSTIQNFISLIQKVFEMKKTQKPEQIINLVVPSFKNALIQLLKNYAKHNNVKNKADAELVTTEYYPELLSKIIRYNGRLEDIFTPKDDKTYYLLRSCFFPIIESISWLSPQNKGFNQTIINYVFYPEVFENNQNNYYLFTDYNSTKLNFKIVNKEELKSTYFSRFILNPYGSLFYTHSEKLAYEVQLIADGLAERRIIKNKSLVLGAILAKKSSWNKIGDIFKDGIYELTEKQADEILTEIEDTEDRQKRISSLIGVDFRGLCSDNLFELKLSILRDQYNNAQNSIKVSLNSGYGILGMIAYAFSDPIAANSITNTGKIYGIKVFQTISAWVMELYEDKLKDCNEDNWKDPDWIDLDLLEVA